MSDCDRTALFSNGNGFVALNSPVKIQILDFLKISSRSFDEIVKHTGKAKSTVSVHLNDLRSSGLVEEEYDPDDKRRKTYHLKCEYMAHSQPPILKHYRNVLETLASPRLEKHGCFKCFFRAIQFGFDAHGINSDPIMRKVGRDIGISISSNFTSKDTEFLIKELAEFWKRYQMGTMYVENREPLVIAVEHSFDYKLISTIGKNLCSFTEGIIEGTIVHSLNLTCCVQEVECCGNGKERCLFVVHFLNKNK
jgi:predicted hydrocarbon binding protein/DNA-binding HxlR family transcriptional regulator